MIRRTKRVALSWKQINRLYAKVGQSNVCQSQTVTHRGSGLGNGAVLASVTEQLNNRTTEKQTTRDLKVLYSSVYVTKAEAVSTDESEAGDRKPCRGRLDNGGNQVI